MRRVFKDGSERDFLTRGDLDLRLCDLCLVVLVVGDVEGVLVVDLGRRRRAFLLDHADDA